MYYLPIMHKYILLKRNTHVKATIVILQRNYD